MKLIQKTVFAPTVNWEKSIGVFHSATNTFPCKKMKDVYVLTKEELIELLQDTFDGGRRFEAFYENEQNKSLDREQFINNILNP